MASGTLPTKQLAPSPNGAPTYLARVLAQTTRWFENGLRSPRKPGMSRDDDAALFRQHVGEAQPLKGQDDRAVLRPRRHFTPPSPGDHREPPGEGYAPEFIPVVERGSRMEFARPGIQRREIRRLRRGRHAIEDQLDLHGLVTWEAERAVLEFIERSRENGLRHVCIVHGKGRSANGRRPVLKAVVDRWLRRCDGVLAFCTAPDNAGGTGAVHVLLRA